MLNTRLSTADKLELAGEFAARRYEDNPGITAAAVYGSCVRGTDLPVSDVDVLLVSANPPETEIQKQMYKGVFIDIGLFASDGLAVKEILQDPYYCGVFRECRILFDRDGVMTQFKNDLARLFNPEIHLKEQKDSILESVERNHRQFLQAVRDGDDAECLRSFIFTLWCFSEYLLVLKGVSPGGFRCLSRLKNVNNDAFLDLLRLQGSIPKTAEEMLEFRRSISSGDDAEFDNFTAKKILWMLTNGFKDEAFHTMWILAGLKIKEGAHDLDAVGKWTEFLGWDRDEKITKGRLLETVLEQYSR